MPESHQPLAAIEPPANDRLRAIRAADLEYHLERRTRRAAMQRTFERPQRARNGRDNVRARGNDHARRESGSVESVIADRIEISLQSAGAPRRWLGAAQLLQVMRGVPEIGPDGDRCVAVKKAPVSS